MQASISRWICFSRCRARRKRRCSSTCPRHSARLPSGTRRRNTCPSLPYHCNTQFVCNLPRVHRQPPFPHFRRNCRTVPGFHVPSRRKTSSSLPASSHNAPSRCRARLTFSGACLFIWFPPTPCTVQNTPLTGKKTEGSARATTAPPPRTAQTLSFRGTTAYGLRASPVSELQPDVRQGARWRALAHRRAMAYKRPYVSSTSRRGLGLDPGCRPRGPFLVERCRALGRTSLGGRKRTGSSGRLGVNARG